MKVMKYILAVISVLVPMTLSAQFYVTGDDPGRLRWYNIETDNYSIIYPEGADSLARVYGRNLEKFRTPVSRTIGYLPSGGRRHRMPVVMHAYNTANGSVAWAPARMDLFTIPSAYEPEPMPWATMLAVHEGRHVAQMQFGMTAAQKPFGWFFGEMWNILASLLYPGLSNIEGDAVIAETALTASGRGRTADFLNYYRVAFDNGDFRRWDQWRLGSQRRYAPDHYALGYMTIGGIRAFHNAPQYMNEAYHLAARRPYNLAAFYTTAKKMTGLSYEKAFIETCHRMHRMWMEEADARAPFIPMEQITADPRLYVDYSGTATLGNDLYSIRKGHEYTPSLVRIDSTGTEHVVTSFAHQVSGLKLVPQNGRIYWSETVADKRWSMKADSKIRYVHTYGGRKKDISDPDDLLFNPSLNDDGSKAATVEYFPDGRSTLTVIDAFTGKTDICVAAPSGLQLVETAWIGNDIFATAISDGGYGIWRLRDGLWSEVLKAQPVMVKDFRSMGDVLMFTCDMTGANELYHLDPYSSDLRQKTVTRYGAEDFVYSDDGKWLYFSSQTMKGKMIFRTPADSLADRPVQFAPAHEWKMADVLAKQEKEIAMEKGEAQAITPVEPEFSQPERYRKLSHMFNVHSWAPVYVNVDNIMNMSFDHVWQAASLGATGIMQNSLATAVGEFGYSAHKDPYNPAKWRHSGHARLTYSGWYPVIEASVDFNDRGARQWSSQLYSSGTGTMISLGSRELDCPYLAGSLKVYVPLSFSSGGWFKGVIPQVSYHISNDRFNRSTVISEVQESVEINPGEEDTETTLVGRYQFMTADQKGNPVRQSLSASLRAYNMLSTPNSAVYPRWGIGAEIGAYTGIESTDLLAPMGYAYVYGYIPGFMRTHGMKLTATMQTKLNGAPFGQSVVNILPRGLSSDTSLLSWLTIHNESLIKVTLDYAFPIFIGDLAIGGNIFSIKRLVVNPHFDYTQAGQYGLFSVGGELILDLNSILTLEWPCSFGLTCSYNSGTDISGFEKESGARIDRFFIGPTFNVSF